MYHVVRLHHHSTVRISVQPCMIEESKCPQCSRICAADFGLRTHHSKSYNSVLQAAQRLHRQANVTGKFLLPPEPRHRCKTVGYHLCTFYGAVAQWQGVGLAIQQSWVRGPAATLLRNNFRQVVNTLLPLSPSSIIWYQRKLGSKQAYRVVVVHQQQVHHDHAICLFTSQLSLVPNYTAW